MSKQTIIPVKCEICGADNPNIFSALELDSFDIHVEGEKKDFYHVCFSCFDKGTEAPLLTEEVQKRMKENSEGLQKTIKEGLICPLCKTYILDENHECPI